jgi:mRNA-degrading endonuclease RelE of RelBE toxin-antitoxin system
VAGPAISERLPKAVAVAVIGLITGPPLDDPRRVGHPLQRELEGIWSARRGTFRVLYRIEEDFKQVVVLRVDHRSDVYRPR